MTFLKTVDSMEVTYGNGIKSQIKLPDIKKEVCVWCHTLFYKET